jgi:hypothetical protein
VTRALEGVRVVVTRSSRQAAGLVQLLTDQGAETVQLALLEVLPPLDAAALERAASELALYLAQESRNGTLAVADPALAAEQFFGALVGHLQLRALLNPRDTPGEAEIERAIGHAVRGFLRAQAAVPRSDSG